MDQENSQAQFEITSCLSLSDYVTGNGVINKEKCGKKKEKPTRKKRKDIGFKRGPIKKTNVSSSEDTKGIFFDNLETKKSKTDESQPKLDVLLNFYNIMELGELLKAKLVKYREIEFADLHLYTGFYISIDKILVTSSKENMLKYCEIMVATLENEIQKLDDYLIEYFEKDKQS